MISKIKKIFFALSPRERGIFLAASLLALVSFSLLVGIFIRTITVSVAAVGGGYVEGFVGQPSYVNPVIASTEIDKSLVRLLFSNVTEVAEKIEAAKDGRIWKVRLKEGLFWHDGYPVRSDDILFTVQKIQDPESRSPLKESWQGVLAERLSEREIQFNLGVPYAFFDATLKNLYILPRHLFIDIPVANWRISDFNLKPMGGGPYRFDSYDTEPNGFIPVYRLVRNDAYFGTPPFITRLTFRFFPHREELIAGFNAGRVDGFAGIDIYDLKEIKRPYDAYYFKLPNYYAVFLNQNQNIALKEDAVRKALSLSLGKPALVSKIFDGHADVANGPLPPTAPYFDTTLRSASSSREDANEILEEAGWKLAPTGFREKTVRDSIIPLEFILTVPKVPFLTETARELVSAWGRIGAKIASVELPVEEVMDQVIKNREYQMVIFGNILNAGSDLYSFWHSSERFYPGLNLSLYNNKEVDQLIETVRQNFDEETLRDQFRKLQNLITGDYPAVFLYSPHYLYVSGKDLKGLRPGRLTEPSERFLYASLWHLRTKRVLK